MSVLALLAVVAAPTGSITVDVGNVRNDHGVVIVNICPKDKFLDDGCPYHGEAKAHAGTTTVVIDNVPAGQYAAQAFHDENNNDKVDRALFGIPKEGVGFSRDARESVSARPNGRMPCSTIRRSPKPSSSECAISWARKAPRSRANEPQPGLAASRSRWPISAFGPPFFNTVAKSDRRVANWLIALR